MLSTVFTLRHMICTGWLFSLVLPTVFLGSTGTYTSEQMKEEYRKAELARLAGEEALLKIKEVRDELSFLVKQADETLGVLEQKAVSHFDRMKILKTSDDGKRIVRNPVSFITYVQLETDPAVTLADIKLKLDRVSSLKERLQIGQKPDMGYLPNKETRAEVYALDAWVKDKYPRLQQQIDALYQIIVKNRDEDVSGAKTLARSLQEYNALWPQLLAESDIIGKQLAKEQKQQIIIDTSKLVELNKAKAEAVRIKAESKAELARFQQDYELRIEKLMFQLDKQRQDFQSEIADLRLELKEWSKIDELNRLRKEVDIDKIDSEIERLKKIKKAQSHEVLSLLGPFLGDSYWQPNRTNRGLKPTPMSLSLLKKKGALATTPRGYQMLYTIGTNPANKDREPWSFPRRYQKLATEHRNQLLQAQQYLIEFGDILVELGYLAP